MNQHHQHARPVVTLLGIAAFALILTVSFQSAQGEWAETHSAGPFQLRSEFRLGNESGEQLLRSMSRLQVEIEKQLNLKTSDEPIEVNLFRSKSSYQSFIRARIPEGTSRQALYVQGSDMGRVYVYRHWGFEQDIRHECTHAVLHNALPYVPLWLDEGFAEYFEVPSQQRASRHPHLNELKRRLLFGWSPDLARLENLDSLNEMKGGEYRESWAWVHFMLHGPLEVRQVLSDYLYDIAHGELAGKLSHRLAARIPDVEDQLVAHLRHWR